MASKSKRAKVEEEKNDIFIVEKVLNRRIGKAGREEFLIQWQGFPESDSSWEPRENLQCVEMLEQFEKEFAKRDKPANRRRQKSPEPDQSAASAEEDPNPNDKYGLNGKQLKCIVGLTKATGELNFLCKFMDDTARLVPSKEVNSRFRPFVDEYGDFLRKRMERRQKRQEEGCRKGVELDCEEDEWPRMPPGFRVLTPREQEEQRRKESAISRLDVTQQFQIQPTATEILQDMHQAANELSSFPPESSDETIGSGDMHESLLHAFDDSSNSPPPCPIVIDTVPDVDDILFPGNS